MTIKEAKAMDMVDYLSTIGYKPVKINGNNYWYTSPLSGVDEKTPSFKINRKLNSWYDWSEGKNIGGNLVDFGILYNRCSVSDVLRKLDGNKISSQQVTPAKEDKGTRIQILEVKELESLPLIRYLQHRNIPPHIYSEHCKEVNYALKGKTFYSIGFKNDSGGYELRNEYSKLSSSPKAATFIDNGAIEVTIFEGFFNFLSYRALGQEKTPTQSNYLVLNSTSFFEKSLPLMQRHEKVHLFLDNDKTGQKFSQQALKLDRLKFEDKRDQYQGFKDLNDWLMHRSGTQRHRLRQQL